MWKDTGFVLETADVPAAMQHLHRFIEEIPGRLAAFSIDELRARPAPGKWSKQEILGHLIDSAINNLKRFTDIQAMPQPYQVIRYQQDALVQVNDYQQLPLAHLLQLWQLLNRQIIYVVDRIRPAQLSLLLLPPTPQPPKGGVEETRTLEWLIVDYVLHMEHHWRQVFR
jgi:hypothetical protein